MVSLHQFNRPVVVAVVAVWVVEATVDQVVNVIPVRDFLVSAVAFMLAAAGGGVAAIGVLARDLDPALVVVALMLLVQVAVVHVVDMIPVLDFRMTTGRTMLVIVLLVNFVHANHHLSG